jgi:ATP synthase protein I
VFKLIGFKSLSASNTTDVFSSMLKIQVIATVAVALLALILSGFNAALSAVLGGLCVIIGAYAASMIARRSNNKNDASDVLINLLKAEAVKILVVIVLLFIIFVVFKQVVPFALIAGLAAAALFSGAALSKLNV